MKEKKTKEDLGKEGIRTTPDTSAASSHGPHAIDVTASEMYVSVSLRWEFSDERVWVRCLHQE